MFDDLDMACPVNWGHTLNVGRVAWWLATGRDGSRGNTWRDLCGLSGRGPNHGTLTNGPVWQGPKGRPGGAGSLNFDGTDDYVSGSSLAALSGGAGQSLAIAAWVAPASFASPLAIISTGTVAGDSWLFRIDSSSVFTFFLSTNSGSNTGTFSTANGVARVAVSVRAGVSCRLYCNGVDVTTSNSGVTTFLGNNGLSIGRWAANNGSFFNGNIDDVSVWSRALTAAEVAADYDLSRRGYPGVLARLTRRLP